MKEELEKGKHKSILSTAMLHHALLSAITLLLLLLPLGTGLFFGSEGDWYSQHVGIAESLRQTMLETGSLIPQYIHLGGGSSIYDVSYYGLLRPDVLFSCLVPELEMKYVIAGYAVLEVVFSVNICYMWLKKQKLSRGFAFAGAVLLACSTCFYQSHHQIMFVNYMPFLFLALLGVDKLLDKGSMVLLIFSLFMIYIHSFYYSIACLFVAGIYMVHQILQQKEMQGKNWKRITAAKEPVGKFFLAVFLSIGMAMVLLLPTGIDILSNEKDAGSFVTVPAKAADLSLKGLLYSPYGCGMTLLTLYCLLLSVTRKGKRFLSVTVLLCMLLPVVSYVLNGFLYTRAKILIPFVAMLVYLAADTLQELYNERQRYSLIPFFCCFIPVLNSSWKMLVLIDGVFLFIWMLLERTDGISKTMRNGIFWLSFLVPVLVSSGVSMSDSCLKPICQRLGLGTGGAYLKAEDDRQNHFEPEEITDFAADLRYRFDVLSNNFVNCNLLANGRINKTAMYSSVTNTDYARFYYDIMKNPISLNNRVALVPGSNPCFSYFMGMRYLLTEEKNLPYGYKKIRQKGDYVLAENEDVLPVCYGTTELISEKEYKQMHFPDTLEVLCSRAVVPEQVTEAVAFSHADKRSNSTEAFISHVQKENVELFFAENGAKKLLHPSGEAESYTLPLAKAIQGKILIVSFHVESSNGKDVVISMNGIKNKLSSESAPYPNNNHDFTYILSAENTIDRLEIEASKGEYTVDALKIYTVDMDNLKHSDIAIPKTKSQTSRNGRHVFEGEIVMETAGYFVTSYPYRRGYRVKVDGEPVEVQKVNTAFIGFPLDAGEHQIEITYEAPGFLPGYIVSLVSCMLFCLAAVWESKKFHTAVIDNGRLWKESSSQGCLYENILSSGRSFK